MKRQFTWGVVLVGVMVLSGCSTMEKAKRADELERQLRAARNESVKTKKEKEAELNRLIAEKDKEIERLLAKDKEEVERILQLKAEQDAKNLQLLKEKEEAKRLLEQKNAEIQGLLATKEQQVKKTVEELSELEKAKRDLEQSLAKELSEYKAKLQMTERGLVLTFLAEIFFDSGRDVVRKEAKDTLHKVSEILNRDVIDSNIAVEGHTDNEPIQKSGWRSNWELSSARALAVVHYFIDEGAIDPSRLSAVGYGEHKPVALNDTPQGKQQNRRVEIVILPAQVQKVKPGQ